MKKVLIITKSFFPDSSVSSFRANRIASGIKEYGWEPYVTTLSKNREDECEKIIIERHNIPFDHIPVSKDAGIRWLPKLLIRTRNLIHQYDFDLLFITGPPFPIFFIASIIKIFSETPYVLDLRDPWSLGLEERNDNIFEQIFKILTIFTEPVTFHYADKIIVNSHPMKESYEKQYSSSLWDISDNKFEVIRNGFSQGDIVSRSESKRDFNEFEVVYPGKFRNSMKNELEAFRRFSTEIKTAKFVHYGDVDGPYTDEVKQTISDRNISTKVHFQGFVDRDVVLSALDRANVGLAVTRKTDQTHIPMKIYDYISRNIPIIVVDDPNGAAAQLVSCFENGFIINYGDVDKLTNTLLHIYHKNIDYLGDYQNRLRFSMSNRVYEVVQVFEKAITADN